MCDSTRLEPRTDGSQLRVLVTGVSGFIGGRAAIHFAERGWPVHGIDPIPPRDSVASALTRMMVADLRSGGVAEEAVDGVDLVLHAAAHTDLVRAQQEPELDFAHNVTATLRLFEAARKRPKPPTMVFLSSFRVYGDNVEMALSTPGNGGYGLAGPFQAGISELFSTDQCERTLHGTHKLLGDLIAQEYAHSFGMRVGVFRVGPVAGPGQKASSDGCWLAALLDPEPDVSAEEPDPDQLLDILHVDDLLDAVERFVRSDWRHLVLNLGGGPRNALHPRRLADRIGAKGLHALARYPRLWVTDNERAYRALGWRPRAGVAKILEELGVDPALVDLASHPAERLDQASAIL
jgi:CDP-paratose 2-epimerase